MDNVIIREKASDDEMQALAREGFRRMVLYSKALEQIAGLKAENTADYDPYYDPYHHEWRLFHEAQRIARAALSDQQPIEEV